MLLLIIIVAAVFLAIRFTDLPGSSSNGPISVLAQTGCLDMDIMPVDHDAPVPLSEAEADARAQIAEVGSLSGTGPERDDDIVLGDLIWAEYGELAPGSDSGEVASGLAWVLAFGDDRDSTWWERLTMQDDEYRFSVVYRPESREIGRACGARLR